MLQDLYTLTNKSHSVILCLHYYSMNQVGIFISFIVAFFGLSPFFAYASVTELVNVDTSAFITQSVPSATFEPAEDNTKVEKDLSTSSKKTSTDNVNEKPSQRVGTVTPATSLKDSQKQEKKELVISEKTKTSTVSGTIRNSLSPYVYKQNYYKSDDLSPEQTRSLLLVSFFFLVLGVFNFQISRILEITYAVKQRVFASFSLRSMTRILSTLRSILF